MKKILITIGSVVGAIIGLIVIKQLDLPVLITIVLVAALIIGMIVLIASQMGEKNEDEKGTSTDGKS